MDSKRKWLILAHCFNMDGRAASQTITDRIPFFMEKGITPVVLSAPTGVKDQGVPHFRVISPAPSGIRFEMRHIINNATRNKAARILLKAILTILCLPLYGAEKLLIHLDSQWSWFLSATPKGLWLLNRFCPEVIYSTAGPPSTHLAAYLLHRFSNVPWIAEVHDPLILSGEKNRWQNYFFKKWIEKKICAHADAIIYFTENAISEVCKRHDCRDKIRLIRPGANPPEAVEGEYQKRDTFHIAHFGSLDHARNLEAVIIALHELFQEQPGYKDRVCLDIYGADLDPVSQKTLAAYPLDGAINTHGRLEFDPVSGKSGRQRVVEEMYRSDLLLLIHGQGDMCQEYIPSKLYEYLLTDRPILGITRSDSELSGMLKTEKHPVVSPGDGFQLKAALGEYIAEWLKRGLPCKPSISSYRVSDSADKIVQIVNGIK
ncbi:MAG: glycosyltransferase [Desulfobacterium sp.]|nr:glycosyltransferase [Desulfobacterium sp.]